MATKTLKNGNVMEVLGIGNTKISLSTENSGYDNERVIFKEKVKKIDINLQVE